MSPRNVLPSYALHPERPHLSVYTVARTRPHAHTPEVAHTRMQTHAHMRRYLPKHTRTYARTQSYASRVIMCKTLYSQMWVCVFFIHILRVYRYPQSRLSWIDPSLSTYHFLGAWMWSKGRRTGCKARWQCVKYACLCLLVCVRACVCARMRARVCVRVAFTRRWEAGHDVV